VWGAERWIKQHPDRLFLDRGCTQPFPINLPDPSKARFHRIVVAHDASRRCREILGGSGSLMVIPAIEGHAHYEGDGVQPFAIGKVDPQCGYVHVFDDTSLDVLLGTLDTISDFVNYLTKKERLIESGKLIWAAGDDDLLGEHVRRLNDADEHDFIIPASFKGLYVEEGMWEEFLRSPEHRAQFAADRPSYAWDAIIERFNHHILSGTWYDKTGATVRDREQAIRLLAREPRIARRALSKALLGLVKSSFADPDRERRRVVVPSQPDGTFYVFLAFPRPSFVSDESYREVRSKMLEALCMVVRATYPQALDIVGLATEAGNVQARSEDILYLDGRYWTEGLQAEAMALQRDLQLLTNTTALVNFSESEYPIQNSRRPAPVSAPARRPQALRNSPCPCGSGRKHKKCCMRK